MALKSRLTFDIETYKKMFCVCALINGQKWQEYIVCPQVEGYADKVSPRAIKGWLASLKKYDMFDGYNSTAFDIRVLAWIASQDHDLTVEEVSEAAGSLIGDMNEKQGRSKTSPCWSVPYKYMADIRSNHFDVLRCYTGGHSLKRWELMRGWSVKESDVTWDDENFTLEKLQESIAYCRHDVMRTDNLFTEKDCQDLIEARQWVIDNAPCKILPDTPAAGLAESYVYGDEEVGDEEGSCIDIIPWEDFDVPAEFRMLMKQMARGEINSFSWRGIDYGVGGAHYAKKGHHKFAKIFDVASLYPHIIKFFTKFKTTAALKRYVGCIDKRLENKKKKGTPEYVKSADSGLKLVLNSVSGKFGEAHSKSYAPEHRKAMCLIGQIMITEAACAALGKEESENWGNLVEINTDSFAVIGDENIERARKYCEKIPHHFMFEEDAFDESYWRDVNNYFVYNPNEDEASDKFMKERHGAVKTNWTTDRSEVIVTESLARNVIKPQGSKPYLLDWPVNCENYLIKFSKAANQKSCRIDGEPLDKKHYYFLWTTEDCPDSVPINLNGAIINGDGTIAPRHGVWGFGGIEEFRKYEQYIDKEQYLEDLKAQLKVWNRPDMVEKCSKPSRYATTFHAIKKEQENGFFDIPDGLF